MRISYRFIDSELSQVQSSKKNFVHKKILHKLLEREFVVQRWIIRFLLVESIIGWMRWFL